MDWQTNSDLWSNKAIAISRVLSLEKMWKCEKTCENLWKLEKNDKNLQNHAQNWLKHLKTHKYAQRDGPTDGRTDWQSDL